MKLPTQHTGQPKKASTLLAFLWILLALGATGSEPVEFGYRDFSYGTQVNSTPTGEKAENLLWWNDGKWWASLWNADAGENRIYSLNAATQEWVDRGTPLDPRHNSKADVLWDATSQKLYLVSHVFTSNAQPWPTASQWGRLYRLSYNPGTKEYSLDAGFPVNVTRGKCETLTLAKDSTGRLWVTYVEAGRVMVNHSLGNDSTWGEPFVLPAGSSAVQVSTDDISAIVAFGGNRVGVMWSNQATTRFYFAVHRDSDPPTIWLPEEAVLPDPNCSGACADDHINLKALPDGRVFATMKTSLDGADEPLVLLGVREPAGTWRSHVFGRVRDHHTRPILLLDEQNRTAHVFAVNPENGGAIYTKSTPYDAVDFSEGQGTPFIRSAQDSVVSNPTSTGQTLNGATDLVVLASDKNTRFYLHNFLDLPSPLEPEIAAINPTSGPVGATVTVTGSRFTGAIEVAFRETPASFQIVSDSEIRATVPQGATPGKIRVVTPLGTGFSPSDFVVVSQPQISSFDPTTGPAGTAVTIIGANFTGTTDVAFHATAAAFNVVSDTQIETAVPTGATTGRIRVTNAAGSAQTATDFTVTASTSLPLKDITFEAGQLLDPITGVDRTSGSVAIESAAPIAGQFSARISSAGSSYLEEQFDLTDNFYLSFYFRIDVLPAGDTRIVQISNGGATIGSVQLRSNGALRLRAESTSIAPDSTPTQPGIVYRLGIHQKRGSGSDAVLELFLAEGNAPFGPPVAALTAGTWTTAADRVRLGATTATAVSVVIDNIRLNAGAMPPP